MSIRGWDAKLCQWRKRKLETFHVDSRHLHLSGSFISLVTIISRRYTDSHVWMTWIVATNWMGRGRRRVIRVSISVFYEQLIRRLMTYGPPSIPRRFQFRRRIFDARDLAAVNSQSANDERAIDMRDAYFQRRLIIYPYDGCFSSHNLEVGQ